MHIRNHLLTALAIVAIVLGGCDLAELIYNYFHSQSLPWSAGPAALGSPFAPSAWDVVAGVICLVYPVLQCTGGLLILIHRRSWPWARWIIAAYALGALAVIASSGLSSVGGAPNDSARIGMLDYMAHVSVFPILAFCAAVWPALANTPPESGHGFEVRSP